MSTTCEYFLEGACGEGICSNTSDGGAFCDCSGSGYFASIEIIFPKDDELVPCNTNIIFHDSLHAIKVFLVTIATISYACSISKRSQAKRLCSFFVGLFWTSAISVLKLIDRERFFCDDFLITIFFGFNMLWGIFTAVVYLSKYLAYISKSVNLRPMKTKRVLKRTRKIIIGFSISAAIACALLFAVPFVRETDVILGKRLLQITFGVLAMSEVWLMIQNKYLLESLLSDVKKVTLTKEKRKKLMKNARNVLRLTNLLFIIYSIYFVTSIISDAILAATRYVFPLLNIVAICTSIMVLYFNKKSRRSKTTGSTPSTQVIMIRKPEVSL